MRRVVFIFALFISCAVSAKELPLSQLQLPPGFSISIYAKGVDNAREMALSKNGVVFVGSTKAGK